MPPRPTANRTRVRQPSPSVVAGQRLDRHLAVEAGDPAQLLADDRGLEPALGRQAGVLPVAAAAAAGRACGQRRLDPVGRGGQDLHRVGPGEPGGGLGDLGQHPLAGQRVPDEDDPARRLPGHAPAALGDLAHRRVRSRSTHAPHVQLMRVILTGRLTWSGQGIPLAGTSVSVGRHCTHPRGGRAHRDHGMRAGRVDPRPHPRGPGPLGRGHRPGPGGVPQARARRSRARRSPASASTRTC